MTISISWATKVINIPQGDLTPISGSLYELNVNSFRLILKNLEASEAGVWALDTHRHNTEVTLGGVTFARTLEIINGYTITFGNGQYAVRLVGANNNISDVVNVNNVSIRSSNSAGLVSVGVSVEDRAAIADAIWDEVISGHSGTGSSGEVIDRIDKTGGDNQALILAT